MNSLPLSQKLEAVLFFRAEPVKKNELCSLLEATPEALEAAIATLAAHLEKGATRLVHTETEIVLSVAGEYSELIETIRRNDLKKDIGKAGAETLAVILYKGPISRSEIDRIRGVNSGYILRNLTTRGLIERTENTKRVEYRITTALLQHLGVTQKDQLPDFVQIMSHLEQYESDQNAAV